MVAANGNMLTRCIFKTSDFRSLRKAMPSRSSTAELAELQPNFRPRNWFQMLM